LVGEAWLEITGRSGMYFNCHDTDYIRKFEREGTLGIGMIHRDDPQQVMNAINAAMYLVNPEKSSSTYDPNMENANFWYCSI
jgi:hypothetical protein